MGSFPLGLREELVASLRAKHSNPLGKEFYDQINYYLTVEHLFLINTDLVTSGKEAY